MKMLLGLGYCLKSAFEKDLKSFKMKDEKQIKYPHMSIFLLACHGISL